MKQGTLKVQILENGKGTAARIHLLDSTGEWRYAPDCLAYEKDCHFTAHGAFSVLLPPGETEITIEKGKEYRRVSDRFRFAEGETMSRRYELERWIDMANRGWFSGDTHVHRSPEDMPHLMEAEDLNIAPVITYWNQRDQIDKTIDDRMVCRGKRIYSMMTQEDERAGGAVMAFNLDQHVENDTTQWYPSQAFFCWKWREQGATIEQEKPFWWEAPVNVALGLVDTMGIVNNHLQRTEVMENEAWGRTRDIRRYPGREGFVNNVLDLYYRYLNIGLKIPISAGSASGVLRNPLGYNRLYVKLGRDCFTYEEWFKGMKQGRAFATNGPMLLFRIDGDVPSLTLRYPSPRKIGMEVTALSSGELNFVDIVRNGKVLERFNCSDGSKFHIHFDMEVGESCWVAARAYEKSERTVRFAHTNPVFLEVPEPIMPSRADAIYYLEWCRELLDGSRKDSERYSSDKERREVEGLYGRVISFYQELAERGS